jgi:hypothetical protein
VKLLVTVVVLALLAVLADVVALRVAERTIATRLQAAADLAERPDVEISGRPFLTQAVRGRYDEVVVRSDVLPTGPLPLRGFLARLVDVEVPLSSAVSGSVEQVPVDRITARGLVTYADLTALVADRGLRVSAASEPGLVRVAGSVEVLGQAFEAAAVSRPTLEGGTLVVTAERFDIGPGSGIPLAGLLDFRVDLAGLPYGLQLSGLEVTGEGVVVRTAADDAVLTTR